MRRKQSLGLQNAKIILTDLLKEHEALKKEVLNSLMGKSTFDPDLIKSMLEEKESQIAKTQKVIADCEAEQAMNIDTANRLNEQFQHIKDWAEEFETADEYAKKMILARMIEKITVNKNYEIDIYFFIALDDFKQAVEESRAAGYNIVVREAERCYTTHAI